ncbi:hypothetical protein [Dyadobacter sp. CY323]|uniref:hypothetical protein n=1 Tax=Dyadobacter sp. CY323 TaxID=2907302 RepID=UPI001F28FF18|nr:hypothetical protein [Dyadobacter sp. CY323]MCE6988012.1 hypothetical protein [Dyadobacter sp. CY323]
MEEKSDLTKKIEALLAEGQSAINDARSYLISQGELVDLSEWVTSRNIADDFRLKASKRF